MNEVTTRCCIVGGGPAGIFLGYLLARSGVDVIVIEKHADFLRDFRGDTVHPSTFTLLDELGLLDKMLAVTDFHADELKVNINGRAYWGPSFKHLKTKCSFIGFAPQWDFLNLMTEQARQFPTFDLRMNTKAIELVRADGRVVGVRCEHGGESYEIHADLVVAADGRSSTLRSVSDHPVTELGIPIDVLWFRLDLPSQREDHTIGWISDGQMLVTIPRRDHYQVAMVIRKGGAAQIKADGLTAFRASIGSVCPILADVAQRLQSWDEVKLLSVQLNSVERWYENGLLLIGDAAHAMSPVGGVGINLAIQDAVATANLLAVPLRDGTLTTADLTKVQQRREPAARKTQRMQAFIHTKLFGRGIHPERPISVPWYARWLLPPLAPVLRRIAGHYIGVGFQPEHIQSPLKSLKE